ncbi:MAG: hypothetical protein ACI8PQ_000596 [Planctomycetota bacterium]|jgi:hypothetical protein
MDWLLSLGRSLNDSMTLRLPSKPLLAVPAVLFAVLCLGASTVEAQGASPKASGAQDTGAQDQGDDTSLVGIGDTRGRSREEIWYSPTAEDWAKPVLLTFQRTWEDALDVSEKSGRPILICVNMDGEIASEHYAGILYRQEATAKSYEPYVCVIASVYRHNARDYDRDGNRLLCPRFGSVTCGEHIVIEPLLFDTYFEGTRVAPRHIGVEVGGASGSEADGAVADAAPETYDVYYAFDTESVFSQIDSGVAGRTFPPRDPGTDRPLLDLVESRDIEHRRVVEQAYRDGDKETRRNILRRVAASKGSPSVDVLRQAIFGLDVELSQMAREILAKSGSQGFTELIAEALTVPMDPIERDALIRALERIGEKSELARTLSVVHQGLSSRSTSLEADAWKRELRSVRVKQPDRSSLESRLDYSTQLASSRPDDWKPRVELAEASLLLAVDPETSMSPTLGGGSSDRFMRLHLEEAQRTAVSAESQGATGWQVNAIVALSSYYLGDRESAYARAEAAMEGLPAGEQTWMAMATVGLFAEARTHSIRTALRARRQWPKEWIADVHDAYTVLEKHPLGTVMQVVAHYDFLDRFGIGGRASAVLAVGIERYPDSWDLHARLRSRVLMDKGVEELEPTYEVLLGKEDASPNMTWYAGYAAIVAGEHYRSAGELPRAGVSYGRAVELFTVNAATFPDGSDDADFYAAFAQAGLARVALTAGRLEEGVQWVERSLLRSSNAADVLDGLNVSAVGTAKLLRVRAVTAEQSALVARIDTALANLHPSQLELPAFEAGGPRPGGGR